MKTKRQIVKELRSLAKEIKALPIDKGVAEGFYWHMAGKQIATIAKNLNKTFKA